MPYLPHGHGFTMFNWKVRLTCNQGFRFMDGEKSGETPCRKQDIVFGRNPWICEGKSSDAALHEYSQDCEKITHLRDRSLVFLRGGG